MNEQLLNVHIENAIQYIEKNYQNPVSLSEISEHLHLNMCYFCSLFKTHVGMNFNQYLNDVRIKHAKQLIEKGEQSMIDIALEVGYNNPNHFSSTFRKVTGMSPSDYKRLYNHLVTELSKTVHQ